MGGPSRITSTCIEKGRREHTVKRRPMDDSGQVTLIFYQLGSKWWSEPSLNILAAVAQMSRFTHVELAIGSDSGKNGEMVNVSRVFNDDVGCELTARTGRNPQYSYLQLGCSRAQEAKMLAFAKSCIGKPFSGSAMARSIFYPRTTDNKSFFCAELVAAVLREGGLLDSMSNPGAATPQGLHDLYKCRATTTANPYLLRQAGFHTSLTTESIVKVNHYVPPQLNTSVSAQPSKRTAARAPPAFNSHAQHASLGMRSGGSSSSLRVLNEGNGRRPPAHDRLGLTLKSLTFG